jgi:hypothetical protein
VALELRTGLDEKYCAIEAQHVGSINEPVPPEMTKCKSRVPCMIFHDLTSSIINLSTTLPLTFCFIFFNLLATPIASDQTFELNHPHRVKKHSLLFISAFMRERMINTQAREEGYLDLKKKTTGGHCSRRTQSLMAPIIWIIRDSKTPSLNTNN